MRFLAVLILLIAAGVGAFFVYRHLTAGPAVVLPKPRVLSVAASRTSILPDGWVNVHDLQLRVRDPRGIAAGADFEVRRVGRPFTGQPTLADQRAGTAGDPAVWTHLADGHYHWQVRLHNKAGISPWVRYKGTLNIDTQPPAPPTITSTTDPTPGTTYHSSTLAFSWSDFDIGAGVAGYSYRLDGVKSGEARTELRTVGTGVTLNGLTTGTWYFHVRALDRAGNWGPTSTFPVRIDVTPPGLAHVTFSLFQFDPQFDTLRVHFAVTRPATLVRIGVYRQSDGTPVQLIHLSHLAKGDTETVAWNGRDATGRLVPAGSYMIYIRAIDKYGHSSLTGWRDFIVNYRRILVSLKQQRLWAYDGSKVVLTSLVTTGNRALPTPTGTYHVMAKFHPYTFISPWPKTSMYYYAPSKVQYALYFRAGGYFIHDAPWRTAFGPGTNAALGTPGTNYTGTHGCINVPSNVAKELYAWANIGTVVQVVQ